MAEHGGRRTPAHPAAVSGPGALSARTDGGPADTQAMQSLPNAGYGEAKAFDEIQSGAPAAGNPVPSQAPQAIPMGAPTQRPDEPVTAGNPMGEGVGPQAAGIEMRSMDQQDAASLAQQLPMLEYIANMPNASPSTRALVRRIKGNI